MTHFPSRSTSANAALGFSTDDLPQALQSFIYNNHLLARWQQLDPDEPGNFVVAQTGFGNGLSFLAVTALWHHYAPASWQLHFISSEDEPLSSQTIDEAILHWPALKPLCDALLAGYPPLVNGLHCVRLRDYNCYLLLGFEPAAAVFADLCDTDFAAAIGSSNRKVDAWFIDQNAAQQYSNDDEKLLRAIANISDTQTTLVALTHRHKGYCDLLPNYGFSPHTETLVDSQQLIVSAGFSPVCLWPAEKTKARSPWYLQRPTVPRCRQVTVIGGGIAGIQTAYALAERGIKVTVLDSEQELASRASGNPQGILYTRLSPGKGELSQFALQSYIYACSQFKDLFHRGVLSSPDNGQLCGTLQLDFNDKEAASSAKLFQHFKHRDNLVSFLDAQKASKKAGVALQYGGLFFPSSGWIHPKSACLALSQHPNICVQTGITVNEIQARGEHWTLKCNDQTRHAEAVVIATAEYVAQFEQTKTLPVKPIRGQITKFASSETSQHLRCVLCHEGYITPPLHNSHTIGASFNQNDFDTRLTQRDHDTNISKLNKAVPSIGQHINTETEVTGRVAFRCTTPDYLPITGRVADYHKTIKQLAPLAKNAKTRQPITAAYYPNLYINIGHGSRGLTSTPLCAELIASQICHSPKPLSWQICRALNPARFVTRAIIRKEI